MRHFINRAAVLLLVCALASVTSLATVNSKKVTFNRDVTVNGTLVKAGTYKISFDDQTSEMTVFSGKKSVATASARLDNVGAIAQGGYSTKTAGESNILSSVDMSDGNRVMILNGSETMVGQSQ